MTQPIEVDTARVLADLTTLRHIGAFKSGVHRPTFSDAHIQSLDWLRRRMTEAGLAHETDGIGNVYGWSATPGPKLLAGSHLESQNEAGWLDGPLGVVYALEAARVLNGRSDVKGGVDVVAWCDEEGHFAPLLGSRSYIGGVTEEEIDSARDRTSGRSLREVLQATGLATTPRLLARPDRHVGYLEAHIEQGDTLERSGIDIGVVTAIVGIWQYEITFQGQQNHAGTTSMAARKDAGLALARFCVEIDDRFPVVAGARTVWTTGRIELEPGAPSIIPGAARMLFQVRDTDPEVVARLEAVLHDRAAVATARGPCSVAVKRLRVGKPAAMHQTIQDAVERASHLVGASTLAMPSGAGHDAQMLATVMPAGMLFVPSIGGISHQWTENTSDTDIATGARAFVNACALVLRGQSDI
jgi:beta-ureidopropionase / N-carbamoyl-L-amino-acid hydrolase